MSEKKHHQKPPVMATYFDPLLGAGYELAKAYVPIQTFNRQYSPMMALETGTLFPELYRPYPY